MRRPASQHFRPDGRPKRAFSKAEAHAEAKRSRKRAYRCRFPGCGSWHVGGRG